MKVFSCLAIVCVAALPWGANAQQSNEDVLAEFLTNKTTLSQVIDQAMPAQIPKITSLPAFQDCESKTPGAMKIFFDAVINAQKAGAEKYLSAQRNKAIIDLRTRFTASELAALTPIFRPFVVIMRQPLDFRTGEPPLAAMERRVASPGWQAARAVYNTQARVLGQKRGGAKTVTNFLSLAKVYRDDSEAEQIGEKISTDAFSAAMEEVNAFADKTGAPNRCHLYRKSDPK
jgi:hypothetical protein